MTNYIAYCAIVMLQLALLAQATDLLGGHAGRVGVSAVLFAAAAAYAYAVFSVDWGYAPWISALMALATVTAASPLLGFLLLALRGNVFLLGTLAFQIGFLQLANNLPTLGGALGIRDIPSTPLPLALPSLIDPVSQSALWLLIPAALLATWFLQQSTSERNLSGKILHWIRDDEVSARSFGIAPRSWRMMAFVVHAAIAATVGVSMVVVQGYVSPDSFDLQLSIEILTVVYLSGTGGRPVIMFLGAILVVALREFVRSFGDFPDLVGPIQLIAINGVLFAVLCLRRRGLLGPVIEAAPSAQQLQ